MFLLGLETDLYWGRDCYFCCGGHLFLLGVETAIFVVVETVGFFVCLLGVDMTLLGWRLSFVLGCPNYVLGGGGWML